MSAVAASQVILLGFESCGKSALFRALTGRAAEEANFRGSKVVCKTCRSALCLCEVVDTPGIRLRDDALTTRIAIQALAGADRVALVVRGTHLQAELQGLLESSPLAGRRAALIVTFADKAPAGLEERARQHAAALGIPWAVINARRPAPEALAAAARALSEARPLPATWDFRSLSGTPAAEPPPSPFETPVLGHILALGVILLMFALPVWAASVLAGALQGPSNRFLIEPLVQALKFLPDWAFAVCCGPYGVITLGWYSFLWAFPLVLLLGLSTALVEETGIKESAAATLDPALRQIGLSGRDLLPVLAGYGCNVVAVLQTRACSRCTRASCISMVAFSSACSYQIGASLSLFNACGHPGMFLPYLAVLFVVGAIHTRVWHGRLAAADARRVTGRPFLQLPRIEAVSWRWKSAARMFVFQAMPIFLLICVVAAVLDFSGVLPRLAALAGPGLSVLGLPDAAAPAVLLSVLRKDGVLLLNEGQGEFLKALAPSEVFLAVYLSSTLSACLVTLWTVKRETGLRSAARLAGRQAASSLVSAWLLSLALR